MTVKRTVSMPEARGLLAASFPMNVTKINDLGPLNEHEEFRGDHRDINDLTEGMKALNTGGTRKFSIAETDETDETVEDDYGFFPMDDEDDIQGGGPQEVTNTPSSSVSDVSDESSERAESSGRRRKKSSLKRGSAYGDGDDVIPLDFERKEFNRVLPKPDLSQRASLDSSTKGIIRSGSKGLFRVSSEPVFVRPVYQSDDEDIDEVATSVHSSGFVEGALKKRISFGTIQIREHAQTIGDNPSCSYGTPVQLDWEHQDLEELKLDDYELYRPVVRTKKEFQLNSFQRRNLLKLNGYSNNEIKETKKNVSKARNQRERTKFLMLNYPQLTKVEDAIESGVRKVKRSVSKSKLNDTVIPRQSSKDDLGLRSSSELSKAMVLEMMDNDVSNVTAPF